MRRTVDWTCSCGYEVLNAFEAEDARQSCPQCGKLMEQRWWARPAHHAQWSDNDAVLVHVNPATGEVMYPADHATRVRDGYERVYLRSLPEVNAFERQHGVANHVMHYDSNGRGLDDSYRGQRDGWNH